MLRGETTKRSDLDPDRLAAELQAHGVARLREASDLWVIFDGSDLRKPHAETMDHLQRVKRLAGEGYVNGYRYRTLNAIGLAPHGRRGLLYHRLFSGQAPDLVSEPSETRAAIRSVGTALAPLPAAGAAVAAALARGFDDVAVRGAVGEQDWHPVCRLCHRDRLVQAPDGTGCQLRSLAPARRRLAHVGAGSVVRKGGHPRPQRQPVTAAVASTPLLVPWRPGRRTANEGEERTRRCWLVEVRLEKVARDPWWLLTDHPVETAEQALRMFRMYCQRWAIEDAFKVGKTCLGGEEVQVLGYEAIRLLVALGWAATGFPDDLGVTLEWGEVRLRRRSGGGEDRPNRPPGKIVLTRGLRRLLDHVATAAILADEERRHGLPPRIAAMLGPTPPTS
jgi:hypothetical protein